MLFSGQSHPPLPAIGPSARWQMIIRQERSSTLGGGEFCWTLFWPLIMRARVTVLIDPL